jgi:cytochrome c peroxidase
MSKRLAIIAVVILLVVVFLPLSNLLGLSGRNEPITVAGGAPEYAEVSAIFQAKCVDCHSPEMTRRPLYASLPIARGMIEEDIQEAERRWGVSGSQYAGREPFALLDLARLESVIRDGSMPPASYKLMHWTAGLGAAEKERVLAWIRAERGGMEAAAEMAAALRGEPVQPLPREVALDPDKVALGDNLFHDVRLSGDLTLSCASCHGLDKGGTDQRNVSVGIRGQEGPINSPTVYNSSYNLAQFWDGRAADLQEQAAGPVENPIEMGARWEDVVVVLKEDPAYVEAFAALYEEGLTKETVTDAIAVFEKTLVTADSPFDTYLRGDEAAITAEQKSGYEIFKSAGCTNCHFGPALGGASFERMGVASDYFAARGGGIQDVDHGRYNVTGDEEDRHAFKVPVLRNVTVTYPYFHDASTDDLGEAVRVMGRHQTGREFDDEEVRLIVLFLESLTGVYQGVPVDQITADMRGTALP